MNRFEAGLVGGNGYRLTLDLLSSLLDASSVASLRTTAVQSIMQNLPQSRVAWLSQHLQSWELSGTTAALAQIPIELAASACDKGTVVRSGPWVAAAISTGGEAAEALLISPANALDQADLEILAGMLRLCVMVLGKQITLGQRVEQLQTLLDLTSNWHRSQDSTQLLENMARAAARILRADRASIFLWDRNRSELVGHPALGVEGEPLRIPDHLGIAGRVLRSGIAERWDQSDDPQAINKRIGEQLGYTTRSLVAVPLTDKRGRTMGVFEVLNHQDGRFTADDERFLCELAKHASAAVENTQRMDELIRTRDRLVQSATATSQLIGNCHQIELLRDTIRRVAPTDLAVLMLGENGTGKEVVSRSLHLQSKRCAQQFVAVNCAAIAESLLESELFGHEKGAFTDAIASRAGKFELAAGGTLLLDEIGEMTLGGQAKLLRVLEEKIVVRVGGSSPIRTDVRVIAATNRDLAELVRQKKFREDLYYRLNVVTLYLPALRDRSDDVIVLAEHFLDEFGHQIGRRPPQLSSSAKASLLQHRWPGNVRELRNLMERLTYLTAGPTIEESDLSFVLSPSSTQDDASVPANLTLNDATDQFQIDYIQRQVQAVGGNVAQAAERLGLHRSNLYRKMRSLGMVTDE